MKGEGCFLSLGSSEAKDSQIFSGPSPVAAAQPAPPHPAQLSPPRGPQPGRPRPRPQTGAQAWTGWSKICAKFAQNLCKKFAKKFAKISQNFCIFFAKTYGFLQNFAKTIVFCKIFANFLQKFCQIFAPGTWSVRTKNATGHTRRIAPTIAPPTPGCTNFALPGLTPFPRIFLSTAQPLQPSQSWDTPAATNRCKTLPAFQVLPFAAHKNIFSDTKVNHEITTHPRICPFRT